jgi:hypothetical protein
MREVRDQFETRHSAMVISGCVSPAAPQLAASLLSVQDILSTFLNNEAAN